MNERKRNDTLPPEEVSLFCEQAAIVLKAGIPLREGMETLAESYIDSRYGARFAQIRDGVIARGQLSDALEQTRMFPAHVIGMTRVGERAGKLDEVMDALADDYAWEADVRQSIKNAILYPTVLVMMMAVVIAILVVSVLPVFSRVFQSLGLSAGAPASLAMRVGMGVGKGMLVLTGLIAILLAVLALLIHSSRRDSVIDRLGAWFFSVRRASERISAARFSSVVSIMLTAGCSLEDAMELAPTVVTARSYRERIARCKAQMAKGDSFASACEKAELFDPIHEKMIRFGAAAGQLDAVMEKLRVIYMEEADNAIHRVVSMIEPALVTILSVVIGGVLLTVMLPLLSILASMG